MERDPLNKNDFPDLKGICSGVRTLLGAKGVQKSHDLEDIRILASMTIRKRWSQIPNHVIRSHLCAPLHCLHTILCFPTIFWTSSSILMVGIKAVPESWL